MHFISILLFAASSSSDNIVVGLSYGAKKIKINFINNVMISFISGVGTFMAMYFGKVLTRLIPCVYENIIGSSLLVILGICLFINSFKKEPADIDQLNNKPKNTSEFHCYETVLRHPEVIDTNNSKVIEFKEAIILGAVLCLNNIGLGLGASITGLNIYLTALASLSFSLLFIPLGCLIGKEIFSDRLSAYSEVISACVIIILGLYEFFV